jgi:hypothetical protein
LNGEQRGLGDLGAHVGLLCVVQLRFEKGNGFRWSQEPGCYMLYELSSPVIVLHSLLPSCCLSNPYRNRHTIGISTTGASTCILPLAKLGSARRHYGTDQELRLEERGCFHATRCARIQQDFAGQAGDQDEGGFRPALSVPGNSKLTQYVTQGTPAEGAIAKLFMGKMKNYIKCVDVAYESSMMEDFYDIQLSVKGMRTLYDSFKDYVQVETLEGENKYMAEGYGLQDAKKGVIFERFPPVLHLQLRRFEYDMEKDAMCKVSR